MIVTINLPLLLALSGMLAWLYVIYRTQPATAVVPAYATVSMEARRFRGNEETVSW